MIRTIFTYIGLLLSTIVTCQDAYFTMTGHRQEIIGTDTFLVADVQTHSNAGFKLGSGQLYFNYNMNAFGPNVFSNGNLEITIPTTSILGKKIVAPPFEFNIYGNYISNDNTADRVSFSWQHDFSHACIDTLNINYYSDVLFTVKLKYLSGKSFIDHGLCLESAQNFIHQTFTACGPDPCNTADCFNFPGVQILNDTLPCEDCLIVYTTENDGPGSLRNAVSCATSGDTIRFANALMGDSIRLTTTELALDKDLSIIAKNDFGILVQGAEDQRVCSILQGNAVLIESVSLVAGDTLMPALQNEGTLTLKDLTIDLQNASVDTAIINAGTLHIKGLVHITKEQ